MKHLLKYTIFCIAFLFSISLKSQYIRTIVKGRSPVKKVSLRTQQVDDNSYLKPKLEVLDYAIQDENGNGVIDKNEIANIEIHLKNTGAGIARDVFLNIHLLSSEIKDLQFESEVFIGNIYSENLRDIVIPVKAGTFLNTGVAHFKIEINERFGNNLNPLELKIGTNQYIKPEIAISEVHVSTDDGGSIQPTYPVYVKFKVENNSPRDISDLQVDIGFDNDKCIVLSDKHFVISTLNSHESIIKELIFTTKLNYPYDEVPLKLHFYDSHKMFSDIKSIRFAINESIPGRFQSYTDNNTSFNTKLISDVDTAIPFDSVKIASRYALVIGNEDYKSYQPTLQKESNVIYARNDALTFKKYANKLMGVPNENIFLLINATYAETKQEIERVAKLLEKSGEDAELIFYYAGHGLPDENTLLPFIIPVDVSAANLHAAVQLEEIYKRFLKSSPAKLSFFIDACFSGGGRESGLMVSRAFSVEPKFTIPNGNLVLFLSSSGSQASLPYDQKYHGFFSYFLFKKLKETHGNITYNELAKYLTETVALESLKINAREQDPEIMYSPSIVDKWQSWKFK